MSKPRIVKDYEKLDLVIQNQLREAYPYGFDRYLITFKNHQGKFVSALPYETEDRYYLIRMTRAEAIRILTEEEDSDSNGQLDREVQEEYNGSPEELNSDIPVVTKTEKKQIRKKVA